jgi:hypothetical protein
MRLSATTRRAGGVTFVEATLENDAPDARRVRVESELDGPVWPPRREGVPAAGWDPEDGTVAVTLGPGECAGLGFASPADPVDPPVSVAGTERATPDGGIAASPAGVVRVLGDPSPPDCAIPSGPADPGGTDTDAEEPPTDSTATDGPAEGSTERDGKPGIGGYPAVAAWLSAVEERIERAGGDGGPRAAADADRLRTVARRAVELAERVDGGVE